MTRVLTVSLALSVLFALLITVALAVEHTVSQPHLELLNAAFAPGQCAQPCWRGMQVDKIGLSAARNVLKTLPDVVPAKPEQCPNCWTMQIEGVQWHGAAMTLGSPPDYQITLTSAPGTTTFRLLDSIALFGPPASVECAVFDTDPQHTSLMAYVTLYFGNGIQVASYGQLSTFDGNLNPLWIIDEVTYRRPPPDNAVFAFPWRGFKHTTGRQCHPGG